MAHFFSKKAVALMWGISCWSSLASHTPPPALADSVGKILVTPTNGLFHIGAFYSRLDLDKRKKCPILNRIVSHRGVSIGIGKKKIKRNPLMGLPVRLSSCWSWGGRYKCTMALTHDCVCSDCVWVIVARLRIPRNVGPRGRLLRTGMWTRAQMPSCLVKM